MEEEALKEEYRMRAEESEQHIQDLLEKVCVCVGWGCLSIACITITHKLKAYSYVPGTPTNPVCCH